MSDLKPCEKCGGTDVYAISDPYDECVRCETCGWYIYIDDLETSIKKWNTRPIEDALQIKLDKYEKANWNAVLEITEVRKKLDIAVEALRGYAATDLHEDADEALEKLEEE